MVKNVRATTAAVIASFDVLATAAAASGAAPRQGHIVSHSSARTPLGVPGQWRLVFDDEFNGKALDKKTWNAHNGWTDQNNVTDHLSNIVVSGGHLLMRLASPSSAPRSAPTTSASASASTPRPASGSRATAAGSTTGRPGGCPARVLAFRRRKRHCRGPRPVDRQLPLACWCIRDRLGAWRLGWWLPHLRHLPRPPVLTRLLGWPDRGTYKDRRRRRAGDAAVHDGLRPQRQHRLHGLIRRDGRRLRPCVGLTPDRIHHRHLTGIGSGNTTSGAVHPFMVEASACGQRDADTGSGARRERRRGLRLQVRRDQARFEGPCQSSARAARRVRQVEADLRRRVPRQSARPSRLECAQRLDQPEPCDRPPRQRRGQERARDTDARLVRLWRGNRNPLLPPQGRRLRRSADQVRWHGQDRLQLAGVVGFGAQLAAGRRE